ncbi:unnamed protein product, partial [Symbiodinium necroappetens]
VWYKLRHLEMDLEVWVGSSHFTPWCTVDKYEEELRDHFDTLPRNAGKVVYLGDVNTGFAWVRDGPGITPSPKEGKGGLLHQTFVEKGLHMGVPEDDQLDTPTSRPRQESRHGQCIDVMSFKGLHLGSWRIHADSFMRLGTDHELCHANFRLGNKRIHRRHETGPRQWMGGVQQITYLDQEIVEHLADTCTKPVPGRGYRDSKEVKQAFKEAKRQGTAALWKRALKLRKEARRNWEQARLVRASEGDWGSFRALKPCREQGWDIGFAEAQSGDPHMAVHNHLKQVYQGEEVQPAHSPWRGDVHAFTVEELRVFPSGATTPIGRREEKVRSTPKEIPRVSLENLCFGHLLEWYNRILVSQSIPQQWNKPILIMLPKIRAPKKAKELRPIAMGSSVSKLFSRLLLNRAIKKISPFTGAQCSGPGRQTGFKLDLEKAFDTLDRTALLSRLESTLGEGAEVNCWRELLRGTVGQLQTPWGFTEVPMNRGIKQGAVESPTMFAWIAELALAGSIHKYNWRSGPRVFDDLSSEEMLYMDDGILWNSHLAFQFSKPGWSSYRSNFLVMVWPRNIVINGTKIEAGESLEVMGLTLRVGISMCELISPLVSRARSKFWELKHIFRAKGGSMKQRARVMQRVVGGTALWCISCVPPDAAAMTMLNSAQLQLMVWLLRFAKKPDEGWEQFRQRAFRGARAALHSAGVERWSTMWLKRYWAFAGHRVRTTLHEVPPISSEFENFRTLPWWTHQKTLKHGVKHQGRHYARLTILEQRMDAVAGYPWRALAYNRREWKGREAAWVGEMDVPWTSGRDSQDDLLLKRDVHDQRHLGADSRTGDTIDYMTLDYEKEPGPESVVVVEGGDREAAFALREILRQSRNSELSRVCRAHLPDILLVPTGDETRQVEVEMKGDQGWISDAAVTTPSEEWANYVFRQLARLAGLGETWAEDMLAKARQRRDGTSGPSSSRGSHCLTHVAHLWDDGTWSTREDLIAMQRFDLLPPGDRVEEEDEGKEKEEGAEEVDDVASFFQVGSDGDTSWRGLREQLGQWFQEGRAVDLALGMLRQKVRNRRMFGYLRWAEHHIRDLELGIALATVPSREHTPPDFFSKEMDEEGYVTRDPPGGLSQGSLRVDRGLLREQLARGKGQALLALGTKVHAMLKGRGNGESLWQYRRPYMGTTPEERIPNGWLPTATMQDINRHLAALSEHNLQIVTVGLLSVLRYLMAELSQCLDFAQVVHNTERQGTGAEKHGDDDEGDDTLLMQDFFRPRLHELPASRPPVAVDADSQEVQGMAEPQEDWLQSWVGELSSFIPGLRLRQPAEVLDTQVQEPEDDIDGLLKDEDEERRWDREEARQIEEHERDQRAQEVLLEQELQYLSEEAKAYQRWEREVSSAALRRHIADGAEQMPKRRCVLSLEVASGSQDRPRVVQTLGFEVPANGSELRMTLRASMEATPSEVPTVVIPPETAGIGDVMQVAEETIRPVGSQAAQAEESMEATRATQVDMLGLLEFNEYSLLYAQWKKGVFTQLEIQEQFGREVMELMLAQEAVSEAVDGENSEIGSQDEGPTQLLPPPRKPVMFRREDGTWVRPRLHDMEAIFNRWMDGLMTAANVLEEYGPVWLAVMQQWRVWGFQAVRHLMPRIVDVTTATGFHVTQDVTQPPEDLQLPLKVPFSAVRMRYWEWMSAIYSHTDGLTWTTEALRARHGDLWVRLLLRIRDEGLDAVRLGLSPLVLWDVSDLGDNPFRKRSP